MQSRKRERVEFLVYVMAWKKFYAHWWVKSFDHLKATSGPSTSSTIKENLTDSLVSDFRAQADRLRNSNFPGDATLL